MGRRDARKGSVLDRLIAGAATVSGGALLLMMLLGAADVILENTLARPVPGALEGTEALMAVVVFLALARTQQAGGHIRVHFLTGRLGPRARRMVNQMTLTLSALFYGILAWQGGQYAWHSVAIGEYESGIFAFPVYPAKTIMALGLSLMAFQCLRQLFSADRSHP